MEQCINQWTKNLVLRDPQSKQRLCQRLSLNVVGCHVAGKTFQGALIEINNIMLNL